MKFLAIFFGDNFRALDTIDHKIPLNKLYRHGVRGVTQNWCENYLSERYQYVSINKCSSKQKSTQGSILLIISYIIPINFLLYINNLPNASNIPKNLRYNDDANIL